MNERELFNEWLKTHPDYWDITVYEADVMFDAWQASANREGCKLVPVNDAHENEYYKLNRLG